MATGDAFVFPRYHELICRDLLLCDTLTGGLDGMPKGRLSKPSTDKEGLWFPHVGVSMKLPVTSTQDMLHLAKSASWKEQRLPLICESCNKVFYGQMEKVQQIPPSTLNCMDGGISHWAKIRYLVSGPRWLSKYLNNAGIQSECSVVTRTGNDGKIPVGSQTGRIVISSFKSQKNEDQNGFPFSSHDNRHIIQGSGEYLDSGLGRRKTAHETRQQTSRNFNLSCHSTPLRPSSCWDGFSNYQITYRGRQDTEAPFCRRYPKHHHERSAHIRDHPEYHFMWFGGSHGLS